MIRFVIPLLLLAVLLMVILVLSRSGRTTSRGTDLVDDAHGDLVARVKDLAWQHRDLEPELAGALIARIRAHQQAPTPEVLDELLEIAWEHRTESPHFSEIVISTIRDGTPPRLD